MSVQQNSVESSVPVEAIIAKHTVTRAIYVAPVLILIFGLTRGWEGAWSSALGVAVVVANFLLAGWILSIRFNSMADLVVAHQKERAG